MNAYDLSCRSLGHEHPFDCDFGTFRREPARQRRREQHRQCQHDRPAACFGRIKRAGRPAQARVRDQFGTQHYVMVEPEDSVQALEAGTSVLLVRHLHGRRFHAIPNPKPELL